MVSCGIIVTLFDQASIPHELRNLAVNKKSPTTSVGRLYRADKKAVTLLNLFFYSRKLAGEGLSKTAHRDKQRRTRGLTAMLFIISITLPHSVIAEAEFVHRNYLGSSVDLADWQPGYREQCFFLGHENEASQQTATVRAILNILKKEKELSDHLIGIAKNLDAALCIDRTAGGSDGYYDYQFNVLAVKQDLDIFTKVLIYIHELRHVEQVTRGFCQSLEFDSNEMVRMTYAIEADASAFSALYAWRLKQNGLPQVWDHISDLEKYADIFLRYREIIESSADETLAMQAAFVQWYESPWRTIKYRNSCMEDYYDLLDETKQLRQYQKLPEQFFEELCVLPGRINYDCHLTDEINQSSPGNR